ncbi:PREDICTED: uncharacterized protein LOC108765753 [Trachymyrmex cornetzi]|uniref:uncharacterized protein LOC108765753 n=1 Tax=Trachymyrmex cornetzi TaxID=471704 RepID=UPI00084F4125|nr:PREDICTED: uncharacterized protein LOC108765753 [Trachymyrmex cornetzi]
MWPYLFKNLYKLVRPRLLKRSRRRPLHPELRLVLTLSYLAHGDSMFSKKAEFRIGRSTAFKILPEVCRIIWDVLQPLYLPQPTHEKWQQLKHIGRVSFLSVVIQPKVHQIKCSQQCHKT